jgi:hypothetical protein
LSKRTFGEQIARCTSNFSGKKLNVGAVKSFGSERRFGILQRAGIPTKSAEELLARMLSTVDDLCADRDQLVREQRIKYPGTSKTINGPSERRFR